MVKDIKANIIEASLAVFMRYGYQKTTMMDIAKEAKVSRQSLYNTFPNKAAILTATMISFIDYNYGEIVKAINDDMLINEKLDIFRKLYVYEAYKVVEQTKGEGYPVSPEVTLYVKQKYVALLAGFLTPYAKIMKDKNTNAEQYAELMFLSLQATKNYADSLSHLKEITGLHIKTYTDFLTL